MGSLRQSKGGTLHAPAGRRRAGQTASGGRAASRRRQAARARAHASKGRCAARPAQKFSGWRAMPGSPNSVSPSERLPRASTPAQAGLSARHRLRAYTNGAPSSVRRTSRTSADAPAVRPSAAASSSQAGSTPCASTSRQTAGRWRSGVRSASRFHTASRPGPPAHSQQARRANRGKAYMAQDYKPA